MSTRTVLVAMSGGVDSSVAAARLLAAGHRVVGAYMSNGVKSGDGPRGSQGCCGIDDAEDARRVADRLGIPFYAVDLEDAFGDLIDTFVDAYRNGRTPNPCIECNRRFKFGRLLALAREIGADSVATGHYARVVRRDGRSGIARGSDAGKDQAYVLFSLGEEARARAEFPLADMTKAEVRREAAALGLPVADKPESMEICFVPSGDYRDVVRERAPDAFRKGRIVTVDGEHLGEHDGYAGYTIGQRKRLPGGAGEPRFVTRIDPETATVFVGRRDDLLVRAFRVTRPVWHLADPEASSFRGAVQVRHRHAPEPCTVTRDGDGFLVTPDAPMASVTPGQAAVVFDGDAVLVGGWIEDAVADA